MPGYTDPLGGSSVQPSQVAYRAVALAADTTLTWPSVATDSNYVARAMAVTAASAGLSLTMPDARVVSPGLDVLFLNPGAETYTVKDNDGGVVVTVISGQAQYVLLTDNTSNQGGWVTLQFASLTSAATAASLVGAGMQTDPADPSKLSPQRTVEAFNGTSRPLTSADVARLLDWTGGSATYSPGAGSSAANLGDGFFFGLRNSGTGTLTFDGGGSLTDGVSGLTLLPGEACELLSNGAEWRSVGRGRSATFNWTRLSKAVVSGTYALTVSESSRVIQEYTGALTGNVTITLQPVVQVYFVQNNTVHATHTVTFTTGGGTSISLTQSQSAVLVCDGVDVYNATTTVSGFTSLLLAQGSAAAPSYSFSGSTDTGMYQPTAGEVALTAGGVQRIRAAATGVLVGGQTTRSVGGAARQLQVEAAAAQASASFMRNSNDAFGGSVVVGKSRGTAVGSNTIVQSGDVLGEVVFAGADGADADTQGALIHAAVDGTPGANDLPTRLIFSTTADGASTVTERMRISSAGVVSITGSLTTTGNATIGDASTDTLTIPLGSAALPSLLPSGATNTGVWFPTTTSVAVSTAGVEAARVDSSGRLLIGSTTSRSVQILGGAAATQLQLNNAAPTSTGLSVLRWSGASGANAGIIAFGKSRGAVDNDYTIVSVADTLGYLSWCGADGSTLQEAARIVAQVDGAPGAGDMPGRLMFYTTPDGSVTPAERMRIDNAGNVGIGMTPTNRLDVTHSTNATAAIRLINADAGAGAQASLIASNGTNTFSMTMRGTGHASVADALMAVTGAATNIVFNTNGSDRARINPSGQMTIGPSMSTARRLTVGDDASAAEFIQMRTTAVGNSGILFSDDSTGALSQGGVLYDHSTDTGTLRASNTAIVNFTSTTLTVNGNLTTTGNATIGNASTDTLIVQAGSAALPSIIPTGDPNTGHWFPAADTMAWSTAGVERVRIGSGGNVEIGTAGAGSSYRLRVETPGTAGIAISTQISASGNGGTGRSASLLFSAPGSANAVDVARIDGLHEAVTATATAGALAFTVASAAGTLTERMRIDSSGNVGIGVTPTVKLHVVTAAAATTIVGTFTNTDSGTSSNAIIAAASDTAVMQLGVNSSTFTTSATFGLANEVFLRAATGSTGLYLNTSSGPSRFGTANVERMRIDSSGRVLIGNTTGTALLTVGDATAGTKQVQVLNLTSSLALGVSGGSLGTYGASLTSGNVTTAFTTDSQPFAVFTNSAQPLLFGTTAQERARIDSNGVFLIGTSTVRTVGVTPKVQIEGVDSSSGMTITRNTADTAGPNLRLFKTRGAALGAVTLVSSGDSLGQLSWAGGDGATLIQAAEVRAEVDGTPGLNDMPGRLIFSTTADGAAAVTERMRISSAGVVSITGTLTTTGNVTVGDASTDTITIPLGAAALPSLLPSGATNTGLWFPSTSIVAVSAVGAEVLRVASGAVSITGTLTTTGNVTVGDASTDTLIVQAGAAALPSIIPTGDPNTGIWFPAADTAAISTAGTERMRIPSTGQLLVGVTAANANGGVLQLSSGITFPAAQVDSTDANTLDDYEEGTFTPALSGTGCTFAYASRSGSYTKIGRQVHVYIAIQLNNTGNTLAANAVTMTGLPFTAAVAAISPVQWSSMATGFVNMNGSTSGTTVVLQGITAANITSTGAVLGTHFDATGFSTVNISLSYSV